MAVTLCLLLQRGVSRLGARKTLQIHAAQQIILLFGGQARGAAQDPDLLFHPVHDLFELPLRDALGGAHPGHAPDAGVDARVRVVDAALLQKIPQRPDCVTDLPGLFQRQPLRAGDGRFDLSPQIAVGLVDLLDLLLVFPPGLNDLLIDVRLLGLFPHPIRHSLRMQ